MTLKSFKWWAHCLILVALLVVQSGVSAQTAAKLKSALNRAETPDQLKENLILPYAFSTETMGGNLGVAAIYSGYGQDQMSMAVTGFTGETSNAYGGGVWNILIPKTKRLFLSVYGMDGYYPDRRAFSSPPDTYTPYGTPLPGSNDSHYSQFLQADGDSNWFDVKLEYSLPFGAMANKGMIEYQTRNGLLISKPSGGLKWDPFESGASVLVMRQFNRYQTFEFESNPIDGTVHALEFGLLYDNTDFSINPSFGSRQYISYSHNTTWFDSETEWDFISLDLSKFLSFGSSEYASQRILALNFWTGYSPSWQLEYDEILGRKVVKNAPYNEGATLGGFYRMRGFEESRFHDKAVIYGSAEYRYTLKYNPIADVKWLKFLKLDWFQFVGFVEAGRVAQEYTINELLTDMKIDYGFSIRALTAGIVVRVDMAHSKEGSNAWVMVDHPF